MKKIFALVLALCMLLCLTACDGGATTTKELWRNFGNTANWDIRSNHPIVCRYSKNGADRVGLVEVISDENNYLQFQITSYGKTIKNNSSLYDEACELRVTFDDGFSTRFFADLDRGSDVIVLWGGPGWVLLNRLCENKKTECVLEVYSVEYSFTLETGNLAELVAALDRNKGE